MSTKISKGFRGWEAETVYQEPPNEYSWQITTLKRYDKRITTIASAVTILGDGLVSWTMGIDPKITLIDRSGRATEKNVKAQHYEALAIFDAKRQDGELPEKEEPAPESDYNPNALGLTESEGDGDSYIGDSWKKGEQWRKKDETPGIVNKEFFIENQNLIRGSIQDNPTLIKGYEFVIGATNNAYDWKEYENDEFTKKMINAFFLDVEPVLKMKKPYLFKEEDKGYSGRKWEGRSYQRTKDLGVSEIAKLVKEELKATFPEMKWSVVSDIYTGGASIRATGTGYPDNPFSPEYLKLVNEGKTQRQVNHIMWEANQMSSNNPRIPTYTEQYKADEKQVQRIVDQYRYDDSDSMTDYFNTNFYGTGKIDVKDWEDIIFKNDPDRKKWAESDKQWDEARKIKAAKVKALREEKGIAPLFTLVNYDTTWGELGKVTVPGVVRKSPSGRARWAFLQYSLKVVPPTHPKKMYRYKDFLEKVGSENVTVDMQAAKLTYPKYEARVLDILKWSQDRVTDKEKKKIKKAWDFSRAKAGISEPSASSTKSKAAPVKKKASTPSNVVPISDLEFTVTESEHTKTGKPIFIAKTTSRVSKEDYKKLSDKAKKQGGYYSRFVRGFIFKTFNEAEFFANTAKVTVPKEKVKARAIALALKYKYK